jgi:DNA-binding NtrC family response regulator
LLPGESGTGKSQVARRIHYESAVSGGPLVEVHCAALPGHCRKPSLRTREGAFTRRSSEAGHLSAAEDGTVFDEIGRHTVDAGQAVAVSCKTAPTFRSAPPRPDRRMRVIAATIAT